MKKKTKEMLIMGFLTLLIENLKSMKIRLKKVKLESGETALVITEFKFGDIEFQNEVK